MLHSEPEILEILKAKGAAIRRADGFLAETYLHVNTSTLEGLIKQRKVKVIKRDGFEFVVSKTARRPRR